LPAVPEKYSVTQLGVDRPPRRALDIASFSPRNSTNSLKLRIPQTVRRPQPTWIQPMLATLTEERFSDPNWIFEKKLDGVRALSFKKKNDIQILSRNQLSFNKAYPEIVEHLKRQPLENFIIDGEIVAFEKDVTSFAKLQQRMQTHITVYYFVFDLIYVEGYDIRQIPLLERKILLKQALNFNSRIHYVNHRIRQGEAYYERACREGWEGVIAKRSESLYVSGRSREWLKFKCSMQQEFVIVGYTDPEGARVGFGALLVGYYKGDQLLYAGKVGTGYNTQTLLRLARQLSSIERKTPAVKGIGLPRKNVHWVEPKLVAQVAFSEWTEDNKLRHPRFLGLRVDKHPREVVKE
jgi:DNA ligase D-like protein (predicted ligase)